MGSFCTLKTCSPREKNMVLWRAIASGTAALQRQLYLLCWHRLDPNKKEGGSSSSGRGSHSKLLYIVTQCLSLSQSPELQMQG